MAVLGLHGSTTLYSVDATGKLKRIANPDAADHELVEDAIAYFDGADRLYRLGALKFDTARATGKSSARVGFQH